MSNFDSMEGMLAKLRAGNRYDLIFPTSDYVNRLIKGNQLLRLDRALLRNGDVIYPFFDDPWYDAGSEHTVPYAMYTTGIAWREDRVTGLTGSWNDLTLEDARGKIFMIDDFKEGIGQANLLNGFDLNTVDPAELERTQATLERQKDYLRGFSTNAAPNLLSGTAWVHHAWNGDLINVRSQTKEPEKFRFQTCTEGIPVGSDCMAIPANARHPGTALLFIDWMLDPEMASLNIEYFGYPMPVKGSEDAFSVLASGDPAIEVTVEDLENGSQFRELPRGGEAAVGPRVDGVQGVTNGFWARFLLPGVVWLAVFFAVPFVIVVLISLGVTNDLGGVVYGWHPGNYADALDPLFAPVLLRSVGYALATALLCLPSATRSRTTSPATAAAGAARCSPACSCPSSSTTSCAPTRGSPCWPTRGW